MIFRAIILCLCISASSVAVRPQENNPASRKFDAFGDLIGEDVRPHLDYFARALVKNPNSTGYIVGYNEQHTLPGRFLRRLYGYWHYLVNALGVNPNNIKVLAGGYANSTIIELWLAPNGDSPPKLSSEMQVKPTAALKFDEVLMGIDCEPMFTLDLYELNDGLKFYANVLRENLESKIWIIMYPNRSGRISKARGIAIRTKNLLARDFNIEVNRIVTRVGNRRQNCMKAEIWIAPAGTVPSTATSNNSLNASGGSVPFIMPPSLQLVAFAPPR